MSTQPPAPPSSTSTQPSPIALPTTTIQPTFLTVLNEIYTGLIPSDKFWVSCYHPLHPSVHAKIPAELDEVDRGRVNFAKDEGVEVSWEQGSYTVTSPISTPTKIYTPAQEYTIHPPSHSQHKLSLSRITAFDISPDLTQFATGYLDGTLLLTPTSPLSASSDPKEYTPPSQITPQSTNATLVNGVTNVQFFPSSRVILASAGDFSLSILPADLPSHSSNAPTRKIDPVQTMRSHTRPITSLGIVGVGRNISSTSLDSSIKLWDVPSASVISSIKITSSITSSSIGPHGVFPFAESGRDPREVEEVKETVVVCGLKNGSFEIFDLGSKSLVFTSTESGGGAIDAIAYSAKDNMLATGSEGGVVSLYDVRSMGTTLGTFYRSKAGILDLAFLPPTPSSNSPSSGVNVGITTADGLPYITTIPFSTSSSSLESECESDETENGKVKVSVDGELVGADCDPVRHIRVRDGEVWCDADDGIVRRYVV